MTTLKLLDGEILDLLEEEEEVAAEADEFKEKIYAATINIGKCCESRNPPSGGHSGSSPRRVRSHGAQVKLLKLVIRNFGGDITGWTTFWDSFESAIDRNPGLSEIDKFKLLLEKSAAEAISGLTLTADNYKEAVSILKKRFGNKQQITVIWEIFIVNLFSWVP